jgi:uncharacterized membrane protein
VLAGGDVLAKQHATVPAMALWFVGCALWIPAMRAPGFTSLIGAADALGLIVVVLFGRVFLHEVLSTREVIGIGFAFAALAALGGKT